MLPRRVVHHDGVERVEGHLVGGQLGVVLDTGVLELAAPDDLRWQIGGSNLWWKCGRETSCV